MIIRLLLVSLLFSSGSLFAQSFMEFVTELEATPDSLRQAKVDSFMQATDSFPVTEDTLAHFVYSGSGNNLAVPGDFSGWNPENAPMTNVEATNFWYRTEVFDNAARLDYKYFYNSNVWILDPRNPYYAPGGFGSNSELRMPQYIPPWEIEYNPVIPHGTLEDTTFYSTNLGNSRTIRVYLPPGYYQSTDSYPVALIHDGLEYISFAKMNNVLDNLIAEDLIRPVIAVFVPPKDRTPEYITTKKSDFTSFIVDELMPWVDGKYRTITEGNYRMTLGSSAGANISMWLVMNHPDVFGIAAPFSPYIEEDIQNYFAENERLDLRIFMIHGTYDNISAIQNSVNSFLPILEAKEYDYEYGEHPEGHSWGFWRAYTGDALMYAFPPLPTDLTNEEYAPETFTLYQNYPNPFSARGGSAYGGNPTTTIKYNLPLNNLHNIENGNNQLSTQSTNHSIIQSGAGLFSVRLKVYDVLGREVATLVNEVQGPGSYSVIFDASGLSSGVYFYRLELNTTLSTMKKMILLR